RAEAQVTSIARVASGRLDRAERLLDPASARRREALLETARSVYGPAFDPAAAARTLIEASKERSGEAKEREEAAIEELDLPAREAEQRVRRGAPRRPGGGGGRAGAGGAPPWRAPARARGRGAHAARR